VVLLSFPLAAEARVRGTKSRLRSVPVKDGLVSPDGAASISSGVKVRGHRLLDAVLACCPLGSGAHGRGRRIVGLAAGSLQRAVSTGLLSAVDGRPAAAASGLGAALRGSITLRTDSVRTFRAVMTALGSGAMVAGGTSRSMSRGLVLVGGCLLEQVRGEDGGAGGDEWGTVTERVRLM